MSILTASILKTIVYTNSYPSLFEGTIYSFDLEYEYLYHDINSGDDTDCDYIILVLMRITIMMIVISGS